MEDDLAELLGEQQMSCRLWPEQTEGPYRRDMQPERRDITEGRDGLPLRVALRLLDAGTGLSAVPGAARPDRYLRVGPTRCRGSVRDVSAWLPAHR